MLSRGHTALTRVLAAYDTGRAATVGGVANVPPRRSAGMTSTVTITVVTVAAGKTSPMDLPHLK